MSHQYLEELAKAVLSLADDGGMPDTFWVTDSRTTLARNILGWHYLSREEVQERLAAE